MTTTRLWDHHLQDLRASGLSDETIAASGCYSATEACVREILGFRLGPGLVFPFPGTGDERGVPFVQVKPDTRPEWLNGAKYITPKKAGCRLYVPPILRPEVLSDPQIPLSITEGAKKALRATQEGLPCVGLAGVDAWRDHRSGKSAPIPDLDRARWKDRTTYIIYDSDLAKKPPVRFAEFRLARELRERGAQVFAIRIPGGPNGEKVGLDDYLNTHGVEAFCMLEPVEIRHPRIAMVRGEPTSEVPPLAGPDVEIAFPRVAYVGVAGEFADLYAHYVESPKPFLFLGYLTYLGALVGPSVTLETELRPSPRLYTVLVGDSAIGRKSSAMGHADRFFEPFLLQGVAVLYGLGSAEGIARVVKEKGLPVLLYFDELKIFVDKAKQEGSVALPMVNTLFEFTKYQNHTRDRSIELESVHLSLLAASTKETYERMWTSQFMDIGFLNRLFIVLARRTTKRPFPDAIPAAHIEGLRAKTREQLDGIWRAAPQPLVLRLTPDAFEHWRVWYEALEDSVYANRLDTIGLRLMMLLAITSGRVTVDETTVQAVVALLDYELAVRKLLDPIDADNAVARMEERIRRALQRGRLKKRDLARQVHAHRSGTWVFNSAIKNLIAEGEVATKGGREFWLRL